jgi:hypothetical protein
MDATFHGGSNDTIGGRVRHRRPCPTLAAVSDIGSRVRLGGRRYHRFVTFNFLLSLAAPHLHGVRVLVTGNKFIYGVIDTGEKFIAGINDTGDH